MESTPTAETTYRQDGGSGRPPIRRGTIMIVATARNANELENVWLGPLLYEV